MGVLMAFFVGWAVGAKAGPTGYVELADAIKSVRNSEEFAALIEIARDHAAAALDGLGKLVSGEVAPPDPMDLLEQVQRLTAKRST